MNRDIFREYDIRGLVDVDLTDDVVRDIGRAFATYMRERGKHKASVGRDCRLSSDVLAHLSQRAWPKGVFPSRTSG